MSIASKFFIILPNASSDSWGRWIWHDAEGRAFLSLSNTNFENSILVRLKKLHFSNRLNKYVWLPLKTIWDKSYPIKCEQLNSKDRNYIIFQSGVKFSAFFLRKLKKYYNVKIVLYLPDTLEQLGIACTVEDWKRYKKHYQIDLVFSFDKNDCQRYDFSFFDFYSVTNILASDTIIDTDVFYIGRCRSLLRIEQMRKVHEIMKNVARCDFRLVGVPSKEIRVGDGIIYNSLMPYEEVVKRVQQSRCLLELMNSGQRGNTLRFKEAICYNKKLLTNNPDVLHSNYYNPRWIQFFENPEDIDVDWITNGDIPDFNYGGEYSPLRLLEMIENS